jgi:hypothetical protein
LFWETLGFILRNLRGCFRETSGVYFIANPMVYFNANSKACFRETPSNMLELPAKTVG